MLHQKVTGNFPTKKSEKKRPQGNAAAGAFF